MTLLTEDELREHITTSLVDAALTRLLADSEAAITAFAGSVDTATEYLHGGGPRITVSRPIAAVTSIQERHGWNVPTTLAADDWELASRFVLTRLRTGTNQWSHFRDPVRVIYEPEDDTATRKIVQVELCKLEIAFNPALASETVGAWTQTYVSSNKTYPEQRADILSRLRESAGMLVSSGG